MGIRTHCPDSETCFQVSGLLGGLQDFTLSPSLLPTLQRITVRIPQGKSLVIKRTRFFISDQRNRFRIELEEPFDALKYISFSNSDEETPNFTLVTNTTFSPILVEIKFRVTNTSTENTFISPESGWWVDFAIE
ncbi:hypothetical protein J2Z37_003210 [Ammoniphilus resinae]|uniref:Uncharacterized protein n=1 Tax=Ammoniphilus resinae TaxID=861532 RepID=A0ABS4GSE0_9BACL|nr:hypothetical protein [Ammoniphilus resinae]